MHVPIAVGTARQLSTETVQWELHISICTSEMSAIGRCPLRGTSAVRPCSTDNTNLVGTFKFGSTFHELLHNFTVAFGR